MPLTKRSKRSSRLPRRVRDQATAMARALRESGKGLKLDARFATVQSH